MIGARLFQALVAAGALAAAVATIGDPVVGDPVAPRIDSPATIRVNASSAHQTIDGFGATHITLVYDGRDVLSPALRARALDAVYNQVGITMGNVEANLLESPGSYEARRNDNDDPQTIDWTGFQGRGADAFWTSLLGREETKTFDRFYATQRINTRWASPWLAALRGVDYQRYLDEAAEQVVAACIYWRDHFGGVTPLLQLFNEPLSGNTEVSGGNTKDLVDLIVRAGDRLRREGFDDVRFVVPNEETEEKSYESAAAILSDARARRYVGAIGYHPYPWMSPYANIRRLLRTSGMGVPDSDRIQIRRRLRDLAQQYHLPLWMTEVSMGGVDARSYEDFRGRAIHIHDELTYADASAYFGMNNMWDLESQREHFGSTRSFYRQEGNMVLLENESDRVHITGMGYAIGHYARWVSRGAVRVDAASSDPLLQATAFRDDERHRLTLVVINNSASARSVTVGIDGIVLAGRVGGEQSTPAGYWKPLAGGAASPTSLEMTVPALSVTTLAVEVSRSAFGHNG